MNYIYGINAVAEALKARGRAFEWVGVAKDRHDLRLQRVIEECRRQGIPLLLRYCKPLPPLPSTLISNFSVKS